MTMNKTYFVTTSDNRSNRKGGLYQVTQDKVKILYYQNSYLFIT